jgi:hypothetical protein
VTGGLSRLRRLNRRPLNRRHHRLSAARAPALQDSPGLSGVPGASGPARRSRPSSGQARPQPPLKAPDQLGSDSPRRGVLRDAVSEMQGGSELRRSPRAGAVGARCYRKPSLSLATCGLESLLPFVSRALEKGWFAQVLVLGRAAPLSRADPPGAADWSLFDSTSGSGWLCRISRIGRSNRR